MKCINCPELPYCRKQALNGGGCDIDGSDDFGCDFGWNIERKDDRSVPMDDDDDLPF